MIKIKNTELIEDIVGGIDEFPKYTTQIINLANQNAQGTRPRVVGQMSDLIEEFPGRTYEEWVKWYQDRMPSAIEDATDKIHGMLQNLKIAVELIDRELVNRWVKDLVLTKTYAGLRFQKSILKKVAQIKRQNYRLSTPQEESMGIDGYIGEIPVSIKPTTYKTKNMYGETLQGEIIFYEKVKDGIKVFYDF